MDNDLISVTEAGNLRNLSRTQILRLCNRGLLLGACKVGNTWVIPRSSVENYEPAPKGFAVVWERRKAKK